MKAEIEQRLQPLLGEPLSDMFRFAGIQAFEFGVQKPCTNRKGEDITKADQRIHVSCGWRITGPEGYILSSEDFGPGESRRDEGAYPFYGAVKAATLIITGIEADEMGCLRIYMMGGYTLEVLPDIENEKPDAEQWRYLTMDEKDHHLVLTAQGVEQ